VNLSRGGLLKLLLTKALFDSKVAAKQTVTCGFTGSTTSSTIPLICIHLIVNLVQCLTML